VPRAPLTLCVVLLAIIPACGRGRTRSSLRPTDLRCEYRVDPAGLDVPQPRLGWVLEAAEGVDPLRVRGQRQTAYRILVASTPEVLKRDEGDLWDSGQVASDRQNQIAYEGEPLGSRRQCWWKVQVWDERGERSAWSAPAGWSMGLLVSSDWSAQWIGLPGAAPLPPPPSEAAARRGPSREPRPPQPVAMFRRSFELPAPVARAVLYATARGVYEVRLNGERVGDHILAPEWTEYDRRIQYQTYDVTGLLRRGPNAVGALLGEGWYAGRLGWENWPDTYGPYPQLLVQLEVELKNGERVVVATDGSWSGTLEGPIRSSGIYDGETVDARRRRSGWDAPGFDDRGWGSVTVAPRDATPLVWPRSEPVGIFTELVPVALNQPQPGRYVFDLGQNMVGWCRFRARGPAGTTVTLRHAEMLNADGTIYTENLRGAKATDTYILAGTGEEIFEPRFTYHGFRYVEVTGLPGTPRREDLVGLPFCTRSEEVGRFESSSELVNALMRNIGWGLRGNLTGVPTDCPQRDERLGWTGDILAFSQTAVYTRDMAALFTKFCQDLRDGQLADGRFPDFAPRGPVRRSEGFAGAPAWGDAGVVLPWRMYVDYGDVRLLEEHYEAARRWIEWIYANNPDHLWRRQRGNDYGDWVNGDSVRLEGFPARGNNVPKEVFATAFWAQSTALVAKMARVLGRDEDARRYEGLTGRIRQAFAAAYLGEEGVLRGDTQGGYALALDLGLVPESDAAEGAGGLRGKMLHRLEDALARNHGHLSTGFHTAYRALRVLTEGGRHQEALRLLLLTTPPSWGYMVAQGATTMWELWDGYVAGRGFGNPGMNSFNHYMFGSVGEWIWQYLVGIYPDERLPGFAGFVVEPKPGPGLERVHGTYRSVRGPIEVDWRTEGDRLTLELAVPPNTTAQVILPPVPAGGEIVRESGSPLTQAAGIREVTTRPDPRTGGVIVSFLAGSGRYRFTLPLTSTGAGR
jgi:alpha-L-rhamnosidase